MLFLQALGVYFTGFVCAGVAQLVFERCTGRQDDGDEILMWLSWLGVLFWSVLGLIYILGNLLVVLATFQKIPSHFISWLRNITNHHKESTK